MGGGKKKSTSRELCIFPAFFNAATYKGTVHYQPFDYIMWIIWNGKLTSTDKWSKHVYDLFRTSHNSWWLGHFNLWRGFICITWNWSIFSVCSAVRPKLSAITNCWMQNVLACYVTTDNTLDYYMQCYQLTTLDPFHNKHTVVTNNRSIQFVPFLLWLGQYSDEL